MNSVREITEECNRLLDIGMGSERMDIHYAMQTLRDSLTKLNDAFNNEYDETEVTKLKLIVERNAILMEYRLSPFVSEIRERYASRVRVSQLFDKVSRKAHSERNDTRDVLWSYAKAAKLLHKSRHLLFELTQGDLETMAAIQERCKCVG